MRKFYQFLMLMGAITLFSCGSSGSDDPEPEPTPSVNLILRSQTISEGAEVDAQSTTVLTLNYNNTVKVTGKGITLNGTAVTAKSNATTAMSVDIPLTLEEGTKYTLKVEKGAIVSTTDPNSSAPELTLNFTTKEGAKPLNNDATALTKKLGWGWNLGNHFDTSSGEDGKPNQSGYWDNATPTQTLFTNLKKAGVSTVRICVTWGNYQTAAPWTIDANYMAEVKQSVDWAEAAGLNVILNMHHDEYWQDIKQAAGNNLTNDAIKARIEATWKQIAEAFKDKGEFLFFESFNEVQDGSWGWGDNLKDGGKQYKTLNEWNQLVVNTIRATGGKNATRWIGVPAYASSPKFALESSFVLPTDAANRIMVSVHFYDPDAFTLSPEKENYGKSEWGHTAAAGKYADGSNEDHVVETFQKLQEKFIANNIPVYIGEYGCVMHTTDRSNLFRNYYLEYVCRAAHTYNLPVCVWDNNSVGGGNEHHGYFNHNDGTYLNGLESLVQTMIKAATIDDADYTLESVYNKAPK
ncbi:MAG: glycoside hydrolase family 5 protein [Prevotella sp.]|nr:glycoside hydrolase family 5 protein [Prevotella sp.]